MTAKNHLDGHHYKSQFEEALDSLPGANESWMSELRRTAIAEFEQVGIPGPKVEEWKYTNLGPLGKGTYNMPSASELAGKDVLSFGDFGGSKVVFTDGFYDEENSTVKKQDGVNLISLNELLVSDPNAVKNLIGHKSDQDTLRNLNTALMTGGYILQIDENVKLAEPIQVVHNTTAASNDKALRTKCFIEGRANSSAQIIETFAGADKLNYWRHHVTEVIVAQNAEIEIYQIQEEGDAAIHTADTLVDVSKNAKFKHYSLNIGGKMSRTEIKPTLNGLEGNVELRGAFLSRAGNAHDVFTHMKHMVPEGNSDQIYRGVLDKGGKSAFQGKVYVAKDAQLTNADQSNKNLLLDRNAEANSKPELLIYADDVKCSHGATVGELDEQAIFYLNSRGLDQKAAKSLLVEAFVAEVFEDINIEQVRAKYLELARAWLHGGE